MSRTLRRKGYEETKRTSWDRRFNKIAGYYTFIEFHYADDHRYWYEGRLPTKSELWKMFKDAHTDSKTRHSRSPGRQYRRMRMKENRGIARRELHKFMRLEDYEPMLEVDPRNCWRDWS